MPTFNSSGLPPPGGTMMYMPDFAHMPPGRMGSSDGLDLHSIAEDMTEQDMYRMSPQQQQQQGSWVGHVSRSRC